jgi:hypothetical protein
MHVRAHLYRAKKVGARRHEDGAAARGMASIDRRLEGGTGKRSPIGDRAKVKY